MLDERLLGRDEEHLRDDAVSGGVPDEPDLDPVRKDLQSAFASEVCAVHDRISREGDADSSGGIRPPRSRTAQQLIEAASMSSCVWWSELKARA